MTAQDRAERHTIAVLADNEPGVAARIIGLFSGRGYNIESLTVAEVEEQVHLSRFTIVTTGTPMIIEQIKAQLGRLVPVHKVVDLTELGPHVERELVLVRVKGHGDKRVEALRIADIFGARVADTTLESFVFIMDGRVEQVNQFLELMRALGETEVVRSGVVALSRGAEVLLGERSAAV